MTGLDSESQGHSRPLRW